MIMHACMREHEHECAGTHVLACIPKTGHAFGPRGCKFLPLWWVVLWLISYPEHVITFCFSLLLAKRIASLCSCLPLFCANLPVLVILSPDACFNLYLSSLYPLASAQLRLWPPVICTLSLIVWHLVPMVGQPWGPWPGVSLRESSSRFTRAACPSLLVSCRVGTATDACTQQAHMMVSMDVLER